MSNFYNLALNERFRDEFVKVMRAYSAYFLSWIIVICQ